LLLLKQKDKNGIMQAYIVTYKDNKVVANEVAKDYRIHSASDIDTDIKVDANNALVDYYSDLLYGYENAIYSVKDGTPKALDIYGCYNGGEHEGTWYFKEHHWRAVPTISEEEFNMIKNKYQDYNFVTIGTELTTTNIDAYIK